MEYLVAAISVIAALHFFFQERHKRKVSFVVHCQGRTAEDEQMDFAVSLFDGESKDSWINKINDAFDLQEIRRGYNNKRMMDLQAKFQEEQKTLKKV